MKLDYCYHTHTSRCGHAYGKDEDFVLYAIKLGIKRLGFSDHVILPEGYSQPGIRGDHSLYDDYIQSVKALREKYKDQIDIIIGFEAEYYPQMEDYYRHLLDTDIEYLVLGQHCHLDEDGHSFVWYFDRDNRLERIIKYVDDVITGIKTGLFVYLAHPDLFMRYKDMWTPEIEYQSRRLLKACEQYNFPIEINMTDFRNNVEGNFYKGYPNMNFFKVAKEYKLRYVIGIDAHQPKNFDQEDLDKIEKGFIDKLGIKIEDFVVERRHHD